MKTGAQLFKDGGKITACAMGEPSLTLVQNDFAVGLLLADGVHEDSFTSRLYLDDVTYLHVLGSQFSFTHFPCVAIYREDDAWVAEDVATGCRFSQLNKLAYEVKFISKVEYGRLRSFCDQAAPFPIVECAQKHFGRLPGYGAIAKALKPRRRWLPRLAGASSMLKLIEKLRFGFAIPH